MREEKRAKRRDFLFCPFVDGIMILRFYEAGIFVFHIFVLWSFYSFFVLKISDFRFIKVQHSSREKGNFRSVSIVVGFLGFFGDPKKKYISRKGTEGSSVTNFLVSLLPLLSSGSLLLRAAMIHSLARFITLQKKKQEDSLSTETHTHRLVLLHPVVRALPCSINIIFKYKKHVVLKLFREAIEPWDNQFIDEEKKNFLERIEPTLKLEFLYLWHFSHGLRSLVWSGKVWLGVSCRPALLFARYIAILLFSDIAKRKKLSRLSFSVAIHIASNPVLTLTCVSEIWNSNLKILTPDGGVKFYE